MTGNQVTAPAGDALLSLNRESVAALSAARDEPDFLRDWRLRAWDTYEGIPMPTLRDEEWRRTDLRALKLDEVRFDPTTSSPVDGVEQLEASLTGSIANADARSGFTVQRDGTTVLTELDDSLKQKGVIFGSVEAVARQYPELFKQWFMSKGVLPESDKFAALHAALFTGGAFLYVPKGVRIDLPIQSFVWSNGSTASFPHTVVVAEQESEVTFVDQYTSPTLEEGAQGFASAAVELFALPGSHVRHVSIQEWGGHTWSFVSQRVVVGRDANVRSLAVAFGGRVSKARVESMLSEPGASAEMLGVLFGTGRQHFDHHTLQEHQAPNTTSDLLYKGALTAHSRSVFSGMIRARKLAQKTDAVQTNRNLLLSDTSRADSIPNLEIEANDLRCTHAATVSPVDEEQLFYLQARGLSRAAGVRLIVEGFFEPLIERVPLAGIADRLRASVDSRIG